MNPRRGFAFLASLVVLITQESHQTDLRFPSGLLIGASSSAYQVEGAWNISDKGENFWDHVVHNRPEEFSEYATGDVSIDFYHKYIEDIQQLKNIGFDSFRFSISWSRLLPKGTPDYISKDGLRYYHNLLDELEKKGIEPFVTIYHWDHPQIFEERGGWLNEKMPYWYADYARVVFREFGSRVKYFGTINEPSIFCNSALYRKKSPSGDNLSGSAEYECLHNMLKGHALAYHIYDDEFRYLQNGQVGVIVHCNYPYSKNESDVESHEIAYEFECGWVANPIFSKEGDYPEIMKTRIAERSKLQGHPKSRLPVFSKEWIEFIKGSSDFFGLNHYTSFLTEQLPMSEQLHWPNDAGIKYSQNAQWSSTQTSWLKVVPRGFGDVLRKIKDKHQNVPVYVTENGAPFASGIDDDSRIEFFYSYLKEMLEAINRDGCDVRMYSLWSLLDSFEWTAGYTLQFGIIQVDFDEVNLKRTPKKSASWFKSILASRKLLSPESYQCNVFI